MWKKKSSSVESDIEANKSGVEASSLDVFSKLFDHLINILFQATDEETREEREREREVEKEVEFGLRKIQKSFVRRTASPDVKLLK
ncbi:hypothetical protein Ddc_24701 [Ditylenchus destructor]|nr:hypothetical protein Ddc_24701 [Ditylenchus destructor]